MLIYKIFDCTPKLIHVVLQMYHGEKGFLAAYSEQLHLHMDLNNRRSSPMDDHKLKLLLDYKSAIVVDDLPADLGESIGIKRK